MAICELCHNDRELRNSHIVPELLYSNLYNEKNHLMAINGRGRKGWKPLQKGLREYLFCETCEQHFNKYYEKPFQDQWVNASLLPNPWETTEPYWVQVEYSSFKLFHLSVLFRAGVSSLPTYTEVSLGPHQERLRQMLLNRDPGEYWQYPVFGYTVIHHKSKRIIPIVSQAQRSSFKGHRCYGIMFGGVQWWVCVSSHRNYDFEAIGLQSDGRMPFHAISWNEVSVIQQAAHALCSTIP